MRAKKIIAAATAGLLLSLLAAGVSQSAVVVTNVELAGPGSYYTVDVNGEDVYDAALVLTIDGHQVLANCDDIYQDISLGNQTTPFNVSNFSSAVNPTNFDGGHYSTAQVGQISWLLDTSDQIWTAGASHNAHEQLDLAALQLASWMVSNPGATYTNYNSGVYALAQTYILDSDNLTTFPGTYVDQLSGGVQGQIINPILTPIPEPASWVMALLGVALVGGSLRLSRKSLAVAA